MGEIVVGLAIAALLLAVGLIAQTRALFLQDKRIEDLEFTVASKDDLIKELRNEREKLRLTVHDLEEVIIKSEERMQEYDKAFQECQRLCEMLQEAKKLI